MNEKVIQRLFGRARNDLRALKLSLRNRDRAQVRLLTDLDATLDFLQIEVFRSSATRMEVPSITEELSENAN
jgi:hypothetical protein